MQLIYQGKTKDVYQKNDGNFLLKFKDDLTGKNGVFDPGANQVGLTEKGAGQAGLRLTKFFFEKLNAANIPTHYLASDIENSSMTVKPAQMFGQGVEVILRYKAFGSFYKRYGKYCEEGDELPAYVEVTLKDDQRNDPLITEDALAIFNIMSPSEYQALKSLTRKIGAIIKEELEKKSLTLYDIKFEFGRVDADKHIALIDEISGGNMRVYYKETSIKPLELTKLMLD